MKTTVYGYARISTEKQKIQRQIDNIKAAYPEAVIIQEAYTGTKMDRPCWNKLYKCLKSGDTVVFDEVSRMSRDAVEGFAVYKELYDRGIHLVFLKESALNTDNFRETAQIVEMTGTDIDCILKGINEYLMILAEKQIQAAFETAQHEVDFLRKRTSEGVRKAQERYRRETALGMEHEKDQVGRKQAVQVATKKSKEAKQIILKHSKDFNGSLKDAECMKLTGLARNTYYKYKKELKNNQ